MSPDEDSIVSEVIDRYLKMRRLDLSIDHGLLWDLSCDVSYEYHKGRVDQRYIESQILRAAADKLEHRQELEKHQPKESQTRSVSTEEELASLTDRQLKRAVQRLYENAEKLVEVDTKNNSALLHLYCSELERRGFNIIIEPQVIVRFKKSD